MISSGSVGTFCSKITSPASSTTHTDVSFTDTSRPTKCTISSLLPDARDRTDLDPLIITERGRALITQAEPQPPRYTIFGREALTTTRGCESAWNNRLDADPGSR